MFSRLSVLSSWSWSTRQSLYEGTVLSMLTQINYAFYIFRFLVLTQRCVANSFQSFRKKEMPIWYLRGLGDTISANHLVCNDLWCSKFCQVVDLLYSIIFKIRWHALQCKCSDALILFFNFVCVCESVKENQKTINTQHLEARWACWSWFSSLPRSTLESNKWGRKSVNLPENTWTYKHLHNTPNLCLLIVTWWQHCTISKPDIFWCSDISSFHSNS